MNRSQLADNERQPTVGPPLTVSPSIIRAHCTPHLNEMTPHNGATTPLPVYAWPRCQTLNFIKSSPACLRHSPQPTAVHLYPSHVCVRISATHGKYPTDKAIVERRRGGTAKPVQAPLNRGEQNRIWLEAHNSGGRQQR